jgi:hypothetical protein
LWARFDGPNSNGVNWNSPSVLVTGKWQFAAVVLTDTSLQFYYNGKPFDSLKTFGSNQAWAVSTLYIANRGAGDRPFYGVVDDPRVYNRALSDAEVNQIYNHSLPKYHGGL